MAFQDYQSIKNLGELQGALSFNDWYRKERTKQSMAEQAAIKASQGELLPTALGAIGRGIAGFATGGPVGAAAGALSGFGSNNTAAPVPTTQASQTNYLDLMNLYKAMSGQNNQNYGGQQSTSGEYTNYSM